MDLYGSQMTSELAHRESWGVTFQLCCCLPFDEYQSRDQPGKVEEPGGDHRLLSLNCATDY